MVFNGFQTSRYVSGAATSRSRSRPGQNAQRLGVGAMRLGSRLGLGLKQGSCRSSTVKFPDFSLTIAMGQVSLTIVSVQSLWFD